MAAPFVITIVGPESSGKTRLAQALAERWGVPWVPEYAREYLERKNASYTLDDLTEIGKGQWSAITGAIGEIIGRQTSMRQGNGMPDWGAIPLSAMDEQFRQIEIPNILIVDSGLLSIRLWARLKYRAQIPFVEDQLQQDLTSRYILCRSTSHWEPDPLREAPALLDRAWIYNHYLRELQIMGKPSEVVDAIHLLQSDFHQSGN